MGLVCQSPQAEKYANAEFTQKFRRSWGMTEDYFENIQEDS